MNFDRNRNKITKMPADLPIFYILTYDILPFGGVKAFYRVGGSLSSLGVEASGATSFLRNKDGKFDQPDQRSSSKGYCSNPVGRTFA